MVDLSAADLRAAHRAVRLGARSDERSSFAALLHAVPLRSVRAARLEKAWSREAWTIEQKLHLCVAAVAVLGWTIAYTTLMHGIDPARDVARTDIRTAVSANLPTPAPAR